MNQERPLPLLSVLVPVYHVESYIERCARSVFEQSYENLEFIFVNDATVDKSIDILYQVIEDYPELKNRTSVINHKHHKGLAAARNTAVVASKGEFIFHVDSDDWVEKNAVELLVKKQQQTHADIVSGEAYVYRYGIREEYYSGGCNLDKDSLLVALLTYRVSTVVLRRLIRTSLYKDNNVFCDERGSNGEDFQVLPRLVYFSKLVSGIKDYIYNYDRSNHNSIIECTKKDVEFQIQNLFSVRTISSFFSDKEVFLQNIVDGLEVKCIHQWLVNNAVTKNRKGFEFFLKCMKEVDPSKWRYVHWDKPTIRHLESNYSTMILLQRVKGFKSSRNKIAI